MCSSSVCDVAGLINGPVGNLVGIGLRALVNGASRGSRSSENLQMSKEHDDVPEFYNNIEAHLKGTLRVLKPALEINRILFGECKSAGRERPAPNSESSIVYYTPQSSRKSEHHHRPGQCSDLKGASEKRKPEKSSSSKPPSCCGDRSLEKSASKRKEATCLKECSKKIKKTPSKVSSSSRQSDATATSHEKQEKSCRVAAKSSRSKQVCAACDISLREKYLLALLPCKHLFCYTCLAKTKNLKCQKCERSFDMKNISQISMTL